jgi:thiamine pyrophosphate-dependent acetolactate synthase large subunit-like protein
MEAVQPRLVALMSPFRFCKAARANAIAGEAVSSIPELAGLRQSAMAAVVRATIDFVVD